MLGKELAYVKFALWMFPPQRFASWGFFPREVPRAREIPPLIGLNPDDSIEKFKNEVKEARLSLRASRANLWHSVIPVNYKVSDFFANNEARKTGMRQTSIHERKKCDSSVKKHRLKKTVSEKI